MQLYVNNKLATLKKVSSCEYVSENQLMHERGLSSSWEWKSPVFVGYKSCKYYHVTVM